MKCGCGAPYRITHTYLIPGRGRTLAAICTGCERKATMVSFITKEDPKHGEGAAALAEKLRTGRAVPQVKET